MTFELWKEKKKRERERTKEKEEEEEEAWRTLDLKEPLNGFDDDGEAQREQKDPIDKSPQSLSPLPSIAVGLGAFFFLASLMADKATTRARTSDSMWKESVTRASEPTM